MNASSRITSRMPRAEYDAIEALNMSRLKEMKRSPLHYLHAIEHPASSAPMTLGQATHVAVLEPERFLSEFANWDRKTDGGRSAPRNGRWWDAFCNANAGKTILTEEQWLESQSIAQAVRLDSVASKYLSVGDPEVTLEWEMAGRPVKGRIDWLTTIEGEPCIVGLKTSRDCRHFQFGAQAARLEYVLQWAWYRDGYKSIAGKSPRMVEIVVESDAPHAVAVYLIEDDILLQGRDNYNELLKRLQECEETGEFPGPVPAEEVLTLPSWYYPSDENVSELGLEMAG